MTHTSEATVTQVVLERVRLVDAELEYEVRGAGEPVVLVHNGVLADWFRPLLDQPALAGYRLVRYHRAGYAGSPLLAGSLGLADHARHCRGLLDHLGIERAHVVGHSSGGNVALQLALDVPDRVASLALLEAALLTLVPSGPYAAEAFGRFQAGDRAGAVDTFLRGVFGAGYRPQLEHAIPGAFEQAVADSGSFFGHEAPALLRFAFTELQARRITQPVLAVLGADSDTVSPVFRQRHERLLGLLPHAQAFVLPDAGHLMDVQNPAGVAQRLAAFIDGQQG
jgi:pimeloyl-ACP methyl ester carboxylesterase